MQQLAMEKQEKERKERELAEMKRLKEAALEEYKQQELARIEQAKKQQEQKDAEFRERLKTQFGFSDEEIEDMMKKKDGKKEKEKEKEREKEYDTRMTWIKVHRKHLLPETLMAYRLPWEWDERDSNYIIIKQWISEDFQEELFAHTRRLREGRLVTQTSNTTTELRVNDRRRDRLYLVRKKSPGRRAFILT